MPWFIIGFLALALLRSLNLIPDAVLKLVMPVATLLTVMAMAALGLPPIGIVPQEFDVETIETAGRSDVEGVLADLPEGRLCGSEL